MMLKTKICLNPNALMCGNVVCSVTIHNATVFDEKQQYTNGF